MSYSQENIMQQATRKNNNIFLFWVLLLQFLVAFSAITLVVKKYTKQELFIELQQLHSERDNLDNEWTQLLLEQSAWSSEGRIEQIARRDLNMVNPSSEQITMVEM